jgi:hypothetical protein
MVLLKFVWYKKKEDMLLSLLHLQHATNQYNQMTKGAVCTVGF